GDGVRRALGIKYHRITGKVDLSMKDLYDPDAAAETAYRHASDFLKKRMAQAEEVYAAKGIKPVITGTYDAELFGHWWFEGPLFLENIIRMIRQERLPLQMILPSEFLDSCPEPQETSPDISSWGDNGYFEPWLNDSNDWIYPRIFSATEKMIEAATRLIHQDLSHLENRALNQAARELMLAQSSDWSFLMHVGSHSDYAAGRVEGHCRNTHELIGRVFEKKIDEKQLKELETKNNIFPRLDFRIFASTSAF
ncbi:MAG: 1,4-alpha-glucan branching protein domain-containing protein, partial [bacterium]